MDSDNDGLNDSSELYIYKTSIFSSDTDNDGVGDQDEVMIYHTNPLKSDSDSDGINDQDEIEYWSKNYGDWIWYYDYDSDGMTCLLDYDSDNDGFSDGEEITKHKTDPLDENSFYRPKKNTYETKTSVLLIVSLFAVVSAKMIELKREEDFEKTIVTRKKALIPPHLSMDKIDLDE